MAGSAAQRVTIVNKKGLHARASAAFARLAGTYTSSIRVTHDGQAAIGTHIMDLLMLAAHQGTDIDIHAVGDDAAEAVTALASLVADGFGELSRDRGEADSGGG